MMNIQYIDTPEQLDKLCQQIRQESWVALDTEFLREKTYYPKFCLLQIATPEWVACVDPIVIEDLSTLFEALFDEKLIKVLHSCRQDLEIFYQITGRVMGPVFDTQVAAPLLGFQENPSYAMLVSSFLNINLNKAHTRTDWTNRPLSQDQIQYAADDVIYLCQIYQKMTTQLEKLGRSDWLEQDFTALLNPDLYQIPPENAWLRIRGKNKLTGRQLSIVQLLAQWREATAQQIDRPRNWLMRDDVLLELAKLQPTTVAQLSKVRQINDGLVRRHGKTLCELIQQGQQRPPIPLKEKRPSIEKECPSGSGTGCVDGGGSNQKRRECIEPGDSGQSQKSGTIAGWRSRSAGFARLALQHGGSGTGRAVERGVVPQFIARNGDHDATNDAGRLSQAL